MTGKHDGLAGSPRSRRPVLNAPKGIGLAARRGVHWIGPRQMMCLLVGYGAALVAYHLMGLTFNVGEPQTVSQFVDSAMLKSQYIESVWYLHSQPPLFNAWMGAVQKWSPLSEPLSYHMTFLALGFVLAVSLNVIARTCGMHRTAAAVLALVIAASPPTVLFQHWFFYDFPMAVLVAATLASFGLWLRTSSLALAAATAGFGAAAVLTRSMLHPVWLVAAVAVVFWTAPSVLRRRTLAVVVLPVILVAALMVKNQVLFGTPQLSSWLGFNMYRTTVLSQDVETRARWQSVYDLPSVNETNGCQPSRPEVEVLANRLKSDGNPNWNWECTLESFSEMEAASLRVIKGEPGSVARSIVGSMEIWFSTTDLWFGVDPGRRQIEPASRIWRTSVSWDLAWDPPIDVSNAWVSVGPDRRNHLSLMALLSTLIVIIGGIGAVRRRVVLCRDSGAGRSSPKCHGRRLTHDRQWARDWMVLGVAGTVGFSFFVGTLFEHGENARFRFLTEPITMVTAGALVIPAVTSLLASFAARRRVRGERKPTEDSAEQPPAA